MAQQVFGSIFGTVTDASGAAVSNAKITIADVNKGTSFEVTTDASGKYNKGQLIPDPYKVTVEAPGIQRIVSNNLDVRVDEAARYDASLKVGDVTTEVEVTAAAPLLQADRADVAQTFTTKKSPTCRTSAATSSQWNFSNLAPRNLAGRTLRTRIRKAVSRWSSMDSYSPLWVMNWTVPRTRIRFWELS